MGLSSASAAEKINTDPKQPLPWPDTKATAWSAESGALRVHNIFGSNMVLRRDKPVTIWGWAETGRKVSVQFGQAKAEATAGGEAGRWEMTFPARQADATGQKLIVTSGTKMIEMDNILIGDVWVMNGQSNMAFELAKAYESDMEIATANLPLLRRVGIAPNESETLQVDIPASNIESWTVCSPKTAGGFSAIGYAFASRLQQALQIPIGIIDNARGGASRWASAPSAVRLPNRPPTTGTCSIAAAATSAWPKKPPSGPATRAWPT